MESAKLTDKEARKLLKMLKHSIDEEINFPTRGNTQDFEVVGDNKKDVFSISIYRGKIQPFKYNLGARIKKNGIMLLELHINPTNIHYNPDGEKISGSHWHIYTEDYGRTYAFLADKIKDDEFIDNTIAFLTKFNVVEQPKIICQLELI